MTQAENLFDYFRNCPLMDKNNRFNFEYNGANPTEYNIELPPGDTTIKAYISGSKIKEKSIILGSVESYSEDARIQIQNSGFYEQLELWIREQNHQKKFPLLNNGDQAVSLECVTSGYLYTADENTANYQIQLKLTYKQGGKR